MNNHNNLGFYEEVYKYDGCLLSNVLKKMFLKNADDKGAFDIVVKHKVADIQADLETLNTLYPLELSYNYLQAIEQSLPGTAFRYAVIHKSNRPALFVYFQLFTLTSQNFNLSQNKKFVQGIFRFFLDLKKAKALICGNAIRTETPSYCYDARLMTPDEALAAIAAIGEKIAAEENATALIIKDLETATLRGRQQLAETGYITPWTDSVMEMSVDAQWNSLTDYTAALSRKYKTRANKALALRSGLTIKPITATELDEQKGEMHRMFSTLVNTQSFTLTNCGPDYFAMLKKLYQDKFEVIGFYKGDTLVAFYSAFIGADAYDIHYVGFEQELNKEYSLYFNLLFTGLEKAIALQKSKLKLGRTSFDAKASLGAQPKPLDYIIKLANLPDFAVNWFVCYFSSLEDAQWKLRNPLKPAA
jgi:hypothetical protein